MGIKEVKSHSRATFIYLNQGKWWIPEDGQKILIRDMDPEWRYNASRLLERRAHHLELRYSLGELERLGSPVLRGVVAEVDGEAFVGGPWLSHLDLMGDHAQDAYDEELRQRTEDPVQWLRSTPLYQALVRGLPTHPAELETLAQRAKHYNWCDVRAGGNACTCSIQGDGDA